jgi:uncharacterized protein
MPYGRSGKLAMQMLEDSLRRYQTDHLDLWQIHCRSATSAQGLHLAQRATALKVLLYAKGTGRIIVINVSSYMGRDQALAAELHSKWKRWLPHMTERG